MTVGFIFTCDLRLTDNHALNTAMTEARTTKQPLHTFFVFRRDQTEGSLKSQHALLFMRRALASIPCTIVATIQEVAHYLGANATKVYMCAGISPFGRARDEEYAHYFARRGVELCLVREGFLCKTTIKHDGTCYRVFTPFWEAARGQRLAEQSCKHYPIHWRETALSRRILHGMSELPTIQQHIRPALRAHKHQLGISAYVRFGVISMREAWSLSHNPEFRRQLFWRDFYNTLMLFEPNLMGVRYQWNASRPVSATALPSLSDNKKRALSAWAHGRTGCEIVDLAMRELVRTGQIPNRMRMIVAYYLCSRDYLGVPWWWGARVFAQYLEDYDWAMNNGNWLWIANPSKPWARPSFQRFNMDRQAKHPDVLAWLETLER